MVRGCHGEKFHQEIEIALLRIEPVAGSRAKDRELSDLPVLADPDDLLKIFGDDLLHDVGPRGSFLCT